MRKSFLVSTACSWLAVAANAAAVIRSLETLASFDRVRYTFDEPDAPANASREYDETGAWRNNTIAGVKYYKGNMWLTVPRWFPGVPSSLNLLVTRDGAPVLRPWPSYVHMDMQARLHLCMHACVYRWRMNKEGDCAALQYVQSMEIDKDGVMWIIDTGSKVLSEAAGMHAYMDGTYAYYVRMRYSRCMRACMQLGARRGACQK